MLLQRQLRLVFALVLVGTVTAVVSPGPDTSSSSTPTLAASGDLSACGPLTVGAASLGPFAFVRGTGTPVTEAQAFDSPVEWLPWLVSASVGGGIPLSQSNLSIDGGELFDPYGVRGASSAVAMVFLQGGTHEVSAEMVGAAGTTLTARLEPAPFDGFNPVFGPHEFLSASGPPTTETDPFTVEGRYVGRVGLVVVQATDADGPGDHLPTFTLKLNGEDLFPAHPTGPAEAVVACASLEATDVISVEVQGQPGEGVRVTIFPRTSEAGLVTPTQGATVSITDTSSPIYGSSVSVPPGAATSPTVISIDVPATGMVLPYYQSAVGPVVEIEPSGTLFSAPVLVGIPYSPSELEALGFGTDRLQIYSTDPTGGTLVLANVVAVDSANDVVYAEVFHFSQFVVGVQVTSWVKGPRPGGGVREVDEGVDASGTGLAAWSLVAPGASTLSSALYDTLGWTPTAVPSGGVSNATHARVALDPASLLGAGGAALAFDSPTSGVWFSEWTSGGWGDPAQIPAQAAAGEHPAVAGLGLAGDFWVAFKTLAGPICVFQSLYPGMPCRQTVGSASAVTGPAAAISAGPARKVAVAWFEPHPSGGFDLDLASWDASSGVRDPDQGLGFSNQVASLPALTFVATPTGSKAVVVWSGKAPGFPGSNVLVQTDFPGSPTQGGPAAVYSGKASQSVESPSVAGDSFGRVHVVWVVYVPSKDQSLLLYSSSATPEVSSAWSAPDPVVPGPVAGHLASARIAADAAGNLRVVWADPAADAVQFAYLLAPRRGNPAFLYAASGGGQSADQFMPLAYPIAATVTDPFGARVGYAAPGTVWVAGGGGLVGPDPADAVAPAFPTTTDGSGVMQGSWVLGPQVGSQGAAVSAFNLKLPLYGSPVSFTAQALAVTTPPGVSITAPAGNSTVTSPVVHVTGTVTDEETRVAGVWVAVTGLASGTTVTAAAAYAAPPFPGTGTGDFSADFTLAQVEGVGVVATAVDPAGNAATAAVAVPKDATPPGVSIASPSNGAVLPTNALQVVGTAADALSPVTAVVVTTLGGASGFSSSTEVFRSLPPASGPGSVGYSAPVTVGTQETTAIEVWAYDWAGNVGTAAVVVSVDTTPPTLDLTAPSALLYATNTASITIAGRATDDLALKAVYLNGSPIPYGPDGAFSLQVSPSIGWNTFTAVAEDLAGNLSVPVTRTVLYDLTAPMVVFSGPVPPISNTVPIPVAVTGTDDFALEELGILSTPATGGAIVPWAVQAYSEPYPTLANLGANLVLNEGWSVVIGQAYDLAGNAGQVTTVVFVDMTPPTVELDFPPSSLCATNVSPMTIAGRATDNIALKAVFLNGASTSYAPDGTFNVSSSLSAGPNTFSIQSEDLAFNWSAPAVRSVDYDRFPPTATFPGSVPAVTNAAYVSMTLLGTDNFGLGNLAVSSAPVGSESYQVWGREAFLCPAPPSASLTATVGLSEGWDVLRGDVTDAAGNAAEVTRSILLDTMPPVVSILTPTSDGIYVPGSFNFFADIQDPGAAPSGLGAVTESVGACVVSHLLMMGGGAKADLGGELTCPDGVVRLTIDAADNAGNVGVASRAVIVDAVPPVIDLSAPSAWAWEPETFYIQGSAVDAGSGVDLSSLGAWATSGKGISYAVGSTLDAAGGFVFAFSIPQAATWWVTLSASDLVGNTTLVTQAVRVDPYPPVVTITAPTAGEVVDADQYHVSLAWGDRGSGVDAASVAFTINGTPQAPLGMSVAPTGAIASFSSPPGPALLAVSVRDLAGNAGGAAVSFEASVPVSLLSLGGSGQVGGVLQTLPKPFAVQSLDAAGHVLADVPLVFASTFGGGAFGSLPDVTILTDPSGRASALFTLGPSPGVDLAQVAVNGHPEIGALEFFSTALTAAVARLVVVSGDGQSAGYGQPVSEPLVVEAVDAAGNPVGGAAVGFDATAGGCVPTVPLVECDARGIASTGLDLGTNVRDPTCALRASSGDAWVDLSATAAGSLLIMATGNEQTEVIGLPLTSPLGLTIEEETSPGVWAPLVGIPVAYYLVGSASGASFEGSGTTRTVYTDALGRVSTALFLRADLKTLPWRC